MPTLGAARQSRLLAVSVAPSINYTSHKKKQHRPLCAHPITRQRRKHRQTHLF